ncbi:E3 ubiquitin-protein ligase ZNRF2-like [Gigantopelta aegis]|uniref:E3 ubiquitin-protein ligase ZNRF2-like n=1 Tax=Gigantopelta aegis TaxID=1735272 RepID=UPI001B88955A|nr:E3 ubiquitin-protein ligase ZNRF2-like [Gigantopelta aegis]
MGLKLSSNNPPRMRTYSTSSPGTSGGNAGIAIARAEASNARTRARSLGSFQAGHSPTLGIPTANGGAHRSNSPDSEASTPDDMPLSRTFAHSLPVHLFALQGIKCPVCSKFIPPEDLECHLVMCLTKPRITYNEDILEEEKGECVICFEDLDKGNVIARLPCLCIYHKSCIDKWFEVNRSCPEHPAE